MSVISKELFYKRIDGSVNCSELHFWEPNCFKSIFSRYLITHMAGGSAKFFLPIYILKLLINYKKMNSIELWKNLVISECRSIAYGLVMGSILISSICILRKITGRLHYYNILFVPGALSGLSLLVETKENQVLDTLIFFNSFLEAVLSNLNYFDVFKLSKPRQTIIFSLVSAALMFLLENRNKTIDFLYLWFYTPPKSLDSMQNQSCEHPTKCYEFSFQGFWKYFSLGYAVNVIRKLLPKMAVLTKRPMEIFRIIFNRTNFRFGLFIGSYVGLYRMLTCYLFRTNKIKRKFHGLIAGLFSGLTYAISPNMQVLVIGITTLLQLIYERISNKLKITRHFWQRQVLFMLCHGALLHNKMYYHMTCPSYYKNMIDACTNNMTVELWDRVIKTYFQ